MNIGIFGLSGSGKSTLAENFEKDGFPSCIDVNIKNVHFHDVEVNSQLDYSKKHYCYIAQDASHAAVDSYFLFDFLILGQHAKGWINYLPNEVKEIVSKLDVYQFAIFEKNCSGVFTFIRII